jgi:predicted transcriptional regulator
MHELPSIAQDFRVARIGGVDAKGESDHFYRLRSLILSNEKMYPRIDKWFDNKVKPGLVARTRVAFIGYINNRPLVSAVLKGGANTKICHLRVGEEFQDKNLGEVMMMLMAIAAKPRAREVHFTLPEGLWYRKREFWESFGFNDATKAGTQYRLFETEFRCSAPYEEFWRAVLAKLPKLSSNFMLEGYSNNRGLVMSIQPKYAEAILSGNKRVEIRRKFSHKWQGETIKIYASKPKCAILGEARISKIVEGSPAEIWKANHGELGCSKSEFDAYTGSLPTVYAIHVDDVIPYQRPVALREAREYIGKEITPPQSYCTLAANPGWAEAVSVTNLLQGGLTVGSR